MQGVNITVQTAPMAEFDIMLKDGRSIRYLPEHYIMTRTRSSAVERGITVDGAVPCFFLGIKNIDEIDLLSLRVTFADGVGDADGKERRWSTSELTSLENVDTKPQRVRIGLPLAQPWPLSD